MLLFKSFNDVSQFAEHSDTEGQFTAVLSNSLSVLLSKALHNSPSHMLH